MKPSIQQQAVLYLCSSLSLMAGGVVSPALPGIRDAFTQLPLVELLTPLIVTLPSLAVALCAPLAGMVIDRMGRRSVLAWGLVIYGGSGISGLWLPSLPTILGGRLVLGLGVALIMTAATTLLADLSHGADRRRMVGFQAGFMGLGGLLYMMLGGVLADSHWRWPFSLYSMAFLLLCFLFRLPAGKGSKSEARGARFRPTRSVLGVYFAGFLAMAIFFVVIIRAPFFLGERLHASAAQTGLALGVLALISAGSSLSFSWLRSRLSAPSILALTFLALTLGLFILGRSEQWLGAGAALLLVGGGIGQVMPNLNHWVCAMAPAAQRGRFIGGLNTAFYSGQFSASLLLASGTFRAALGA